MRLQLLFLQSFFSGKHTPITPFFIKCNNILQNKFQITISYLLLPVLIAQTYTLRSIIMPASSNSSPLAMPSAKSSGNGTILPVFFTTPRGG